VYEHPQHWLDGTDVAAMASVFFIMVGIAIMVIHSHILGFRESIRRSELQANRDIEVAKLQQCNCDDDEEEGGE
jgi:hypothetical protein